MPMSAGSTPPAYRHGLRRVSAWWASDPTAHRQAWRRRRRILRLHDPLRDTARDAAGPGARTRGRLDRLRCDTGDGYNPTTPWPTRWRSRGSRLPAAGSAVETPRPTAGSAATRSPARAARNTSAGCGTYSRPWRCPLAERRTCSPYRQPRLVRRLSASPGCSARRRRARLRGWWTRQTRTTSRWKLPATVVLARRPVAAGSGLRRSTTSSDRRDTAGPRDPVHLGAGVIYATSTAGSAGCSTRPT